MYILALGHSKATPASAKQPGALLELTMELLCVVSELASAKFEQFKM